MKTLMVAAIRCSLIFLVPSVTYAVSAQWDLDPISGDWNTAANWTPDEVPNGPADIATFGLSNTTDVSISEDTEVNGIVFTPAATNPYSITVSSGVKLTLSGTGITNNSGITQGFVTEQSAQMRFTNSASAGNTSIAINGGDFSSIEFNDSSTAANATIQGHGTQIFFSGSSTGGTAAILLSIDQFEQGSSLDISGHNAPGVTIGSLADEGFGHIVFLGANNLTIGSNNLSTSFFGLIQDGGVGGGIGGSLTKIGSGTLILGEAFPGANTYTGDTNINGGVLQLLDRTITSNTFVNQRGTLAGTGGIDGNVMNNGKVSPGSVHAGLIISGNYTQAQYATLMIQIAGASPDQFSVLNVLGNANLNGFLDPVLLNGFVPSIGDSFVFLNYGSLTGAFSRIQHQIFNNGTEQWSVTYELNHAILTVEANVPDQGSTFLLLTLALLGLATYRRQLPRGQP